MHVVVHIEFIHRDIGMMAKVQRQLLHVERHEGHGDDVLVSDAISRLRESHLVVRDGLTVLPEGMQAVAPQVEAPDGHCPARAGGVLVHELHAVGVVAGDLVALREVDVGTHREGVLGGLQPRLRHHRLQSPQVARLLHRVRKVGEHLAEIGVQCHTLLVVSKRLLDLPLTGAAKAEHVPSNGVAGIVLHHRPEVLLAGGKILDLVIDHPPHMCNAQLLCCL
mmetsp:Transcript_16769/g.46863  ORF Transcript_16769/g.46863 Transcript_16769/m.46863 type:complete len:222 (+) Transcript_16769:1825-2490(+)